LREIETLAVVGGAVREIIMPKQREVVTEGKKDYVINPREVVSGELFYR